MNQPSSHPNQETSKLDTFIQGMDVSVILPTFNERDNICDLIDAINQELVPTDVRFELLVMDDSSPDGTAEIVEERYDLALHEANSSKELIGPLHQNGVVRVCIRTQNRGLANSIRDGLERASGQTLVVMDTDFNHDPAMIPQMVELLRYYDLVIGSRFVMHGGMEEATRYWASFLYNVFIRILFQTKIQDNLSGFFAIRTERLFELEPQFDQVFYGYGDYFIRLLLLAWRKKWRILEVPVFYVLRRHGESKTGFWSIFREYTMAVLKLRFFGL